MYILHYYDSVMLRNSGLEVCIRKKFARKILVKIFRFFSFSESDKVVLLLNFVYKWVQIISDRRFLLVRF